MPYEAIDPDLIQRMTGGWLAVAPRSSKLKFAVMAPTKEEAQAAFARSLLEWNKSLALKGPVSFELESLN